MSEKVREGEARVLVDGKKATHYIYPYDVRSTLELPTWRIELEAFKNAPYEGSLSKFEHLKNVIGCLWPDMVSEKFWNPWLERCLRAFTNEEHKVVRHGVTTRTIVLSGCAAVGKTFSAGLYTVVWWLASPANSLAYFTSTSKDMVRKRIWPIIQKFSKEGVVNRVTGEVGAFGGHMVNSKPALQMVKGDDKHSISALAVASGETTSAVAKLSGQHEERILLVIDEGQATPEAIYETIPNLRKGCRDLTIIIIENPIGRLTPSGRASEPEGGWGSVGLEDDGWATKGVPEWQLDKGVCVRFDGRDSPNVKRAEEAGITGEDSKRSDEWLDPWPFIFTYGDWVAANHPDRVNTLSYWTQDRGIQAPEGTLNTVMSEQMVMRHEGFGEFDFYSKKTPVAALDPAFGGDRCVLRFGEVGDVLEDSGVGAFGGREGVQLRESVELKIDPSSEVEIEGQIAEQVKVECQKRGVLVEDFALDATGTGRGVAYALSQIWGSGFHKVEFGGAPSEIVMDEEGRLPRELFDRRVTELWFMVVDFLKSGMLRGLDARSVREFCSREYSMLGKKYKLETKKEMKAKTGYSPDEADAVAVLIDLVRSKLNVVPRTKKVAAKEQEDLVRRVREEGELEVYGDESGGWGEESFW